MPRTTPNKVKAVLRLGSEGGDYDDVHQPSLTPYIHAASVVIDDWVHKTMGKCKYPESLPEHLETWLAAHFYVMSDQVAQSKSLSGVSVTTQGQTGMGLLASKYGQVVLTLDICGILSADITASSNAEMTWLGYGSIRCPP